jgi:hypothetical protein
MFWFPLQLLSEIFLTLRRTERDMTKNIYWCSCTVPLFLSDCNETWIFMRFSKNTLISNFMKIRPMGAELLYADGRTDMTKIFAILRKGQIKTISKLPVLVITKFVGTRWGYDVNFRVHTHTHYRSQQKLCFDGLLFNFMWKPKWLFAVRESF